MRGRGLRLRMVLDAWRTVYSRVRLSVDPFQIGQRDRFRLARR
jgi:hypothetical protein